MDVGIKTANDQFQSVTTTERNAIAAPVVGQCVWDSDLRQLMVYMNATTGNAWQPIGNSIVCASTTRPVTPFEGQVIRETDTNKELTYSGAAWVETNTWNTTAGASGVNNLIVPPLVRVRRATTQSIPNATSTFVTWTIEDYDTDGCFTASSDTITIKTAGVYTITCGVAFAGNVTASRRVEIMKNPASATDFGSTIVRAQMPLTGFAVDAGLVATTMQSFAVSDTIKVSVNQASGGALDIVNVSWPLETHLAIAWIGRAS